MGRHKDRKELKGKRGPGKKAKKQVDPKLPIALLDREKSSTTDVLKRSVGGHSKQRAKKRAAKKAATEALQFEIIKRKKKGEELSSTADEHCEDTISAPLFTDDNQAWLKPVKDKSTKKRKTTKKESFHQDEVEITKKKKKNVASKKQDLLGGGSDGNGSENGK